MPNQHVLQRLVGIQTILKGVHQAGGTMSAATRGHERAAFIDQFLSQALPNPYRFGTGDATDSAGRRSGQLDVVVEYPFAPTLPLGAGNSRLYLAEGVAAVVEVKSDVSSQWNDAVHTAQQLSLLTRTFGATMSMGVHPSPTIPLFVAGYSGWKQLQTVQQYVKARQDIAGVLVIDPGIFVGAPQFGGITATGSWALWGLIASLYWSASSLQATVTNPLQYAS